MMKKQILSLMVLTAGFLAAPQSQGDEGSPSVTPSPSASPVPTVSPSPEPSPTLAAARKISAAEPIAGVLPNEIDRIENGIIYFKTGKPFQTAIQDLRYLGVLRNNEAPAPYLVLIGRACQDCGNDKTVYLLSLEENRKLLPFTHPGRILDSKSRRVVYEGRTFFGRCLPGRDAALVTFQKEYVDKRRRFQSSVSIAEPGRYHLDEMLMERGLPSIKTALQRVKQKQCFEIETRHRLMQKRMLNLTPRINPDKDDDDDDESNEKTEEQPAPQVES